ncbi:MAG TPA: ABC transporter substrate-binding protein [Paraburkholderia sp.]|uniref:MlaC/ttg2D family ABC transporter substrate-binding protein n=1 Tax=Paraburkholderia sp. TaxID=1926495 RepID=UPI002B493664|nr:ABC transporter substrate-binding protein [Paraburkholderia sp.]HKR40852.1 ABC transporter substrate-binding protein [Paraburkholderia sp.]
MKQAWRTFLTSCLMSACVLAESSAWAAPVDGVTEYVKINDQSDPQSLIRTATEEVQDEIRARTVDPHDTVRIMDIVNRDILPYTNIRRTAQLAMGRYWKMATPSQQVEITQQFQLLLIHTYSGALGLLTPGMKFKYPTLQASNYAGDAVVRTIAIYNGGPVEIDYRLYRASDGWRVYDINLLGVWLVQVYRQQFSEVIIRDGVEGLIRSLEDRNRNFSDEQRKQQ